MAFFPNFIFFRFQLFLFHTVRPLSLRNNIFFFLFSFSFFCLSFLSSYFPFFPLFLHHLFFLPIISPFLDFFFHSHHSFLLKILSSSLSPSVSGSVFSFSFWWSSPSLFPSYPSCLSFLLFFLFLFSALLLLPCAGILEHPWGLGTE